MKNDSDYEGLFRKILEADYSNCDIQLCLASLEHISQDVPAFEKVQLSTNVAERFREIAQNTINKLEKGQRKGDIRLIAYDASAMNRSYEIEYLDLRNRDDLLSQYTQMKAVARLRPFTGNETFVAGLRFFAIVTRDSKGLETYFFRAYSPKSELSRSSFFGIHRTESVYDVVEEPVFLFDDRVDCIISQDFLFIMNKDKFQKIFRFFEMLREAGREALKKINERVKIENFDALSRLCEGHLQKMAKLKNIMAKPYLQYVTMSDIKKVIRRFKLPLKIVKKEGEERLLFDPNDKDKWLVLRILDDDYLGSVITKLNYEANSKRQLT